MTPDPERIQITPASDLGIFWALVRPFATYSWSDTRLKCLAGDLVTTVGIRISD